MGTGYAAGWYQDPGNVALIRYWDGSGWTEHAQLAPCMSGYDAAAHHRPVPTVPDPVRPQRRLAHTSPLTMQTVVLASLGTAVTGVVYYFVQVALLERGFAFGVYLAYVMAFLMGRIWSAWGSQSGWPAAVLCTIVMAVVWNAVIIAAARPSGFDVDQFAIYRFAGFGAVGGAAVVAIGDRARMSSRVGAALFGMAVGALVFALAPAFAEL